MAPHVLLMTKLPMLYLFRLSPLLWPFNLYLPLVRHLPRVCVTLSAASTLFAFRLHQIVAAERQGAQRFERAVRLVSEQLRLRSAGHRPNNVRIDYGVSALLALSL